MSELVVSSIDFCPIRIRICCGSDRSTSDFSRQVVFEEFGFAACYRCPSAALSCYHEQVLEEERENV